MKKVILLAMLMPVSAFGQIIENFESGNLNNWVFGTEGHWKSDTSQSITGSYSLHHIFDNTSSGSDCIGLSLTNLHPGEGLTRWSFLVRHGYNPSSSNSWAAFLMSDTDPASFANGKIACGYALGVNLTGNDDIVRLWKVKNGTANELIAINVNWETRIGITDAARIVVERSAEGVWHAELYDSENNQAGIGSASDSELFSPSWFILNYRYSSTCDRLLWFDNLKIDGVIYDDIRPPEITSCLVSGTKSLDITFNEEPAGKIMLLSNYSLNDEDDSPVSIEKITPAKIRLLFHNLFNNKTKYNLKISQLCDMSGNCTDNVITVFTPIWADPGDVIISEIMADPMPPVSLPSKEYLEINNRTEFPFDLTKWNLFVEGQKTIFPSVLIKPGESLIICASGDTSSFSNYGKVVGLKSFPVLADAGRSVMLTDSLGNLIHGIEYNYSFYGDALKTGGGWSMEMIDTGFPFYTEGNWEASTSKKGGTPGMLNSVSRSNPDILFSGICNVFPIDSLTLYIRFSETLFSLVDNIDKISIGKNRIMSVLPSDPLMRQFNLVLSEPLLKGKIFSLELSGDVTDFAGNNIVRTTFRFGVPETAAKGDIVFNELLFNPFPNDPDYVELYNCSEKAIDISRLYLASINYETGDTSEVMSVSEEQRSFIPGSCYAVTTDVNKVLCRYFASDPDNIFYTGSLPSMPDDKGHLLLLNREMDLIDEVIYSEKMHFPLLAGNEGVSLEKIRPEIASDVSMSWHSASESSGWGTPGLENSVYSPELSTGDQVVFSSGKISPDNDGYEDLLVIDLLSPDPDNVVSITIFDETGTYVRKIAENLFAGNKTSVIWDGSADNGSLVNTGIYIVFIELYNDKGKIGKWKKVCTVIR